MNSEGVERMRLSKVFALVQCVVSFASIQALAQTQADDVHFISSELGGKETIKITKLPGQDGGKDAYLVDRCDAQRAHCAPLVQGHEQISLKELEKQEVSVDLTAGIKSGVAILAAGVIGTALGGVPGAVVFGAGGLTALNGARFAYNERQMRAVNEPANSNDDLRVFNIQSYDKALSAEVIRASKDEAQISAKAAN
jgi:hypothetical protein